MSSQAGVPHLLEHPVSSYAQKVKIALREKNVEFTSEIPSDISSSADGPLHHSNPRVEVPVLIHNGNKIFDSTIILEYIEDMWSERPLLPKDPGQRAKARMIEDVCDTQYEAVNWGLGEIRAFARAEGALKDQLEGTAQQQTATLQDWLEQQLEGPWFNGSSFGWADASVAPIVNRSVVYGYGPSEGSKLKAWHQRLMERESVKKTFEEFEKGLGGMRNPAIKEMYLSGQMQREYRDHRLEWMIKSGGMEIIHKGLEKGNIRFSWP